MPYRLLQIRRVLREEPLTDKSTMSEFGQELPHVITTEQPSERPLYFETCQRVNSHCSAHSALAAGQVMLFVDSDAAKHAGTAMATNTEFSL